MNWSASGKRFERSSRLDTALHKNIRHLYHSIMVKLRGRGDSLISGLSLRILFEDFFICHRRYRQVLRVVWGQLTKCLDYYLNSNQQQVAARTRIHTQESIATSAGCLSTSTLMPWLRLIALDKPIYVAMVSLPLYSHHFSASRSIEMEQMENVEQDSCYASPWQRDRPGIGPLISRNCQLACAKRLFIYKPTVRRSNTYIICCVKKHSINRMIVIALRGRLISCAEHSATGTQLRVG